MIGILGLSALSLSMLDSSIAAPTSTFRSCLHDAAAKATGEKVGGDKIEDYLKSTCTTQLNALTSAIIAFNMKNRGMSKKAAADDAAMTVDDYVASPADNYRFMINWNAPAPQAAATPAATPATPPPQPSSQPHRP